VPYHVFIDISKNPAIERSKCEEREEADDHGGGKSRETGRSPAADARMHQAANPQLIERTILCCG
jgi:hypothetical protein